MATVTLEIPDVKGLNISAMKEELGRYAHYLAIVMGKRKVPSNNKEVKLKTLHSLYATFDTPSDKSFEELRAEAMQESYGI